jgi:hypothetical protein
MSSRSLFALAHREAADRVTVERHSRTDRRAFAAQVGKSAPWTIANSACGESARGEAARAQRCVSRTARAGRGFIGGGGMHWSSAIMMSLPMAICVSMLTSGLSRSVRPSM